MKRLNVRLLAITFTACLLAATTAYFLHAWQVRRLAGGLLRRADLAEQKDDWRVAANYVQRYLQSSPNDVTQRLKLAELFLRIAAEPAASPDDIAAASRAVEEALRFDVASDALRQQGAEFFLRQGRPQDALAHLQAVTGEPNDQRHFLQARCLLAAGEIERGTDLISTLIDFDRSTESFRPSTKVGETNVSAHEQLARIYRLHFSKRQVAAEVLNHAVEQNPASAAAYLARAQAQRKNFLLSQATREQCRADLQAALRLAPTDAEVLIAAAEIEQAFDDEATAAELFERGLSAHPLDERFARQRAVLAWRGGDLKEAKRFVSLGLANLPTNFPLRLLQGELALAENEAHELREVSQHFRAAGEACTAEYLDARLLILQKDPLAAAQKLQRHIAELADRRRELAAPAYICLADCYEQLGQSDRQLEAARQAVQMNSTALLAKWSEVRALAALGRNEEARIAFRNVKDMATRRGASLAGLSAWEQAFEIAEQRATLDENSNWREAERTFTAELDADASLTSEERHVRHLRFLLHLGEVAAAETRFREAIADQPQSFAVAMMGLEITALQHSPTAAIDSLRALEQKFGDSVALRVAHASLQCDAGAANLPQALALLEIKAEQFSPAERVLLFTSLAKAQFRAHDFQQSIKLWRQAAQLKPEATTWIGLFETAREAADEEVMAEALNGLGALVGKDDAQYKYTAANRLIWEAKQGKDRAAALQTARTLLREARKFRPHWQALALLEADIATTAGDADAAIAALQLAAEQGPATPYHLRRLVELLLQQQRHAEARRALALLGRLPTASASDDSWRSQAHAALGDQRGAVALAAAAAESSQRAEDFAWLSQLQASSQDFPAAAQSLQKAIDLSPRQLDLRLALVQIYEQAKMRSEALAEISRLRRDFVESDALLTLMECYEAVGDTSQAALVARQAMNSQPNRLAVLQRTTAFWLRTGSIDEGAAQLDQILALPNSAGKQDVAAAHRWARRAKGELLLKEGRYADFLAAQSLLEGNAAMSGEWPPIELSLFAAEACRRSEPEVKLNTITKLQHASEQRALTVAERLYLAQLHEQLGHVRQTDEIFASLLSRHGDHEAVVSAWCKLQLNRGKTGNVESWLRKMPPASPFRQKLQAALLVQLGRRDEGATLLNAMVVDSPFELAAIYEEAKLLTEAETLLRSQAEQRPAAKLQLAAFLLRREKCAEAIEQLREICAKGDSQRALELTVSAALRLPPNSPAVAAVSRDSTEWLSAARSKRPDDAAALLLLEAMLKAHAGDETGAKKLYRDILAAAELPPQLRAAAQNNYAYLLASDGTWQEAEPLVSAATVELGPSPELLDTTAMVLLAKGDKPSLAQAKAKLELALLMTPDARQYFHLAVVCERLQQTTAAKHALDNAIKNGLSPQALSKTERQRYDQLVETLGQTTSSLLSSE